MSREYPDRSGDLSVRAMQDALDELDQWIAALIAGRPELVPDTIPKCMRVVRLVEAMPRRSPWIGISTGDGATIQTMMWNMFFFAGDDASAILYDPRYRPKSEIGRMYADVYRKGMRQKDEWYRRWDEIGGIPEEEVVEIWIVNKSTQVTNAEVELMTAAVNLQVHRDFAPQWGITAPSVSYLNASAAEPANTLIITILDNSDQAGALGYHTEGPNGIKYGRVFAEPVLQNGGNALTDPLSVASVLSHETLEATADLACNRWADNENGTSYALEVGDPVESDSYPIIVGSQDVTVSNFVLPAWFDPMAASGAPVDHLKLCTAPFEVRPTGYVVTMTDGNVSQTFGEHYPEWRKATKETETSRTNRRLKQGSHESRIKRLRHDL